MVQILDEWNRFFAPASPLERGLMEHIVQAHEDRNECVRVRATLRAEAVRTADRYYEEVEEDAVDGLRRMLDGDPWAAVVGLKRSAAGCRWLIARWEHLEQALAAGGTWYGCDRIEAIQLQGLSAMVDDLYISEQSYVTWLHCLAAQPNPKERDIALVLDRRVMPKAIQDQDVEVWPGDRDASRAALEAIVARELPPLRARAELLRVRYEEPARAEAKEQALARLARRKDEVALLWAQRSHEQAFERASWALLKARAALVKAGLRPDGPVVREDKLRAVRLPLPGPPVSRPEPRHAPLDGCAMRAAYERAAARAQSAPGCRPGSPTPAAPLNATAGEVRPTPPADRGC
jgi:hypothetical protein